MSYRRIVIGVDFSTASLDAVRWVATAFAPHAQLFLAHVVTHARLPSFLGSHVDQAGDPDVDEPTLYPGLAGFAGLAGAPRAEVTVRRGEPADELAALAREVDADLVCVGRSRRRRGSGRFGATTPQRVLARTTRSVLLVPAGARLGPARVLAAVSDGTESEAVLRAATTLTADWDARVDALHALDVRIATSQSPSVQRLTESWLTQRTARMCALSDRVTAIARTGEAGEAILTHAGATHSDLVVMGRRTLVGRSATLDGCVGSTTRLITWTTPCPVLVVGSEPSERASDAWEESDTAMTLHRARAENEVRFRRRRGDRNRAAQDTGYHDDDNPPAARHRGDELMLNLF